MLSPRNIVSPRQWRLRKKKKNSKMDSRFPEKSVSCRDVREQSEVSSLRHKFIEKRPNLWELSSSRHRKIRRKGSREDEKIEKIELGESKLPEVQRAMTMKFSDKNKARNSCYYSSTTSDSEYLPRLPKNKVNISKLPLSKYNESYDDYDSDFSSSSSVSSFVHLDSKNRRKSLADEPRPELRKASALKSLMLQDMREKIDRDIIFRETSNSSVIELKTEPEIPSAMKNLLTLRVKQEAATDLQISMWKMKTRDFGDVDWENFINEYHHVVIDRSSKYAFIETSKLVRVY